MPCSCRCCLNSFNWTLHVCSPTSLLQADAERAARLRQVQDELQIEDEHLGGGRYNDLLELQRKNKKGSNVPRSDSDPAAAASLQAAQVPLLLMVCTSTSCLSSCTCLLCCAPIHLCSP